MILLSEYTHDQPLFREDPSYGVLSKERLVTESNSYRLARKHIVRN